MSEGIRIISVQSSGAVIRSHVCRWKNDFAAQEVWHCEPISIGGTRRFGYLEGAERKFLVANLQTFSSPYDSTPEWQIVDTVDEEEFDRINRAYVEAHLERWMTPVGSVSKPSERSYVHSWTVDANRLGLYAVYSADGILRYMVKVSTLEGLFDLFDRVESYAPNFRREELVDLGYLTLAQHTSWLGTGGTHVHAVEAYFRKLPTKNVYFLLDTWCSGNHWLSVEHSPKAIFPTLEHVTCKKCRRKLEQLAGYITALNGVAAFLEGQKSGQDVIAEGRYQYQADLISQVAEVIGGQIPKLPPSHSESAEPLDPSGRHFVYEALQRVSDWMDAEIQQRSGAGSASDWRRCRKVLGHVTKGLGHRGHP